MSHVKLPSPKSCCISGLFFSNNRSWTLARAFPLFLGVNGSAGQGAGLPWGTGDILPSRPRGTMGVLSPVLSAWPFSMAPGETETCTRAESLPPAPPLPACPLHLLKASPLLKEGADLPYNLVVAACAAHFASFSPPRMAMVLKGG